LTYFPLPLDFDEVAAYPTIPEGDIQEYHRNLGRLNQVLGSVEKYIHLAFAVLMKEDIVQKMFMMVSYYTIYARIKINVTAHRWLLSKLSWKNLISPIRDMCSSCIRFGE
jgi:hypothetical protein